ncbi:XDD3 family exosortase-dependent surface protein [Nostoc sp. NMS8]|uniref:XDD3 family exosortase-dependent surface protein n=1 Tax=Nostoc sp. NMS8 TaxID=2815392 RepID=UPI0025DB4460|nr:XDD3 family exosortase-dependent surface protein [Nostoc sp. NMS8]MBN3957730.1 PEP-CTERM sorting domain-containing protein [Nostoc sp. NMS8]
MKTLKVLLATTAISVSLLSLSNQQASAGQLVNGWNYSIDSFQDGSGGSVFDIKGMAVKDSGDKIYVALTGGMPLSGTTDSDDYWNPGHSVHIGWSDLFFNFSGKDFQTASQSGQLFGVRFADYDSSLTTGVYQGVQAKSITTQHGGYSNLKWYYDWGWGQNNTQGTDLATTQDVYNYYYGSNVAQNPTWDNTPILNAIGSGTKVGNISMLNDQQLNAAGLNFSNFSATGQYTLGFSFDKALIGEGNYVSNIFLECGNDGVALKGDLKSVPESAGTIGLLLTGLSFMASQLPQLRKKKQEA